MKKNIKTPSNKKGKRVHGFRKRMKSRQGKEILNSRRRKKRKRLSV